LNKLVEVAFKEVECGFIMKKQRKNEVGKMMVKVVELVLKAKELEVFITTMENEVKELHELLIKKRIEVTLSCTGG